MKTIKIASLGEGKKSVYDSAGNRYHMPERFREGAKMGDYVLLVDQTFTSKTELNDKQEPVVVECDPWTRTTVTMVGDFKDVTIAKNEAVINAGVEAHIVKEATIALAKELNVELEDSVAVG